MASFVSLSQLSSMPASPTHQSHQSARNNYAQMSSPLPEPPIEDNDSPLQGLVPGYRLIRPLNGPVSNSDCAKPCVCTIKLWCAWCPRAQEHYNSTVLHSSRFIHYPCRCGWTLSMGDIPKWCPKAASHLLDWVRTTIVGCVMCSKGVG